MSRKDVEGSELRELIDGSAASLSEGRAETIRRLLAAARRYCSAPRNKWAFCACFFSLSPKKAVTMKPTLKQQFVSQEPGKVDCNGGEERDRRRLAPETATTCSRVFVRLWGGNGAQCSALLSFTSPLVFSSFLSYLSCYFSLRQAFIYRVIWKSQIKRASDSPSGGVPFVWYFCKFLHWHHNKIV